MKRYWISTEKADAFHRRKRSFFWRQMKMFFGIPIEGHYWVYPKIRRYGPCPTFSRSFRGPTYYLYGVLNRESADRPGVDPAIRDSFRGFNIQDDDGYHVDNVTRVYGPFENLQEALEVADDMTIEVYDRIFKKNNNA